MNQRRLIGVNIVSLFPFCLGKNGLMRAIKLAREAGFFGLQILPIRGWKEESFTNYTKNWVVSYEKAWNGGSFLDAIYRKFLGLASHIWGNSSNKHQENYPLFKDWLLFGSWNNSGEKFQHFQKHFQNSIRSTHAIIERGAYTFPELHPEMMTNMMREDMARGYLLLDGLVWDTEHIVRPGRHGEDPVTENWRDLLNRLNPEQIKLIHIKTFYQMAPYVSNGEYMEMLMALAEKTWGTKCPIIFEGKPPHSAMINKKEMINWLKSERESLEIVFG